MRSFFSAIAADTAEMYSEFAISLAIPPRVSTIKARVIGGKVLGGDVMFVDSIEALAASKLAEYGPLVPLAESVAQRQAKEFPGELPASQK